MSMTAGEYWDAEKWEQADDLALAHLEATYKLNREAVCKAIHLFYRNDVLTNIRANKARPNSGDTYYAKLKKYLMERLPVELQEKEREVIDQLRQFYPETSVPINWLNALFRKICIKRIDELMRKNSKSWTPMIYREQKWSGDILYKAIFIKKRKYYEAWGKPIEWKTRRGERYALLCMVDAGTYVPGAGYKGKDAMVIE